MKVQGSRTVVLAALAGNAAIAVTKFAAAYFTGSSAMLSEAIHSLADTGNQGLLLYGSARAARPPDAEHPFGNGREVFFWGFVVAIVLFALGSGVSIYQGILKLLAPHPIENVRASYIVLGLAFCFEGASTFVGFREFNRRRGDRPALWALRASKDPRLFTVLVEDSIALAGLAIAAAGIAVTYATEWHQADGLASITIGLLLGAAAAFLAYEVKSLLIGEAAYGRVRDGVRRVVERQLTAGGPVRGINDIRTLQLGPFEALVIISLDFADDVTARTVERIAAAIEREARTAQPEVRWLFVEAKSRDSYRPKALVALASAPPAGNGG